MTAATMAYCLLLLLMVFGSSVTLSSSQCTEASLLQFDATAPSIFNNISSDVSLCVPAGERVLCGKDAGTAVIDNDNGPSSVDISSEADIQSFFTWRGEANIVFKLNGPIELASLELYFLNYPSQRIGLPAIELFSSDDIGDQSGTHINYVLYNSGVISSCTTDNIRRKVTLGILRNQNLGSYSVLRVNFSYTGVSNIDWFFPSEINLCTSTTTDIIITQAKVELCSNNPSDSVQLRCSVSSSATSLFGWQWRQGNNTVLSSGRFQTSTTDGTRTGILEITGLRSSDEGSYTCCVKRQGPSSTQQESSITLVLPVAVAAEPTAFARPGESVNLTCEVFGYLRPGQDHPSWSRTETGTPIQDGGKYTIAQQTGSRPSRSPDGTSAVGLVTMLTINPLDDGDTGNYSCSAIGITTLVMTALVVTSDPPTTIGSNPVTTPGKNGTANSGTNIGLIAAAVIVSLLFLVALVITLIVIAILVMRRRKRMSSKPNLKTESEETNLQTTGCTDDDIQPQIYSTVNKKAPPIPARNYDESELEDIANVHTEQPKESRLTLSSSPPELSKITDSNKYTLFPNASSSEAATAETTKSENWTSNELQDHIYAPPSLGRCETPSTTLRSGGPIYSEALEPSMFSQKNPSNENDLHPYGPIYTNPKALKKADAPLEVTAANIREVKQLGIGGFGEVVLAETIGVSLKDMKLSQTDDNKSVHIQVAIKKPKLLAKHPIQEAFEKEIKFMSQLKNDNVVRLLAICTTDTPFIVMEYMENGDLNQYLKKHDLAPSEGPTKPNQLPVSILLYMAVQIASGMRYLASLKYVHRDMATRNCLVGMNFTVKISDFGMSRNLYEHSYYHVQGTVMLPVRWMATESFYGQFSEKTDVWSFGVTMWEIFTLTKTQPYEELDDQEMIQDAIRGASRRLLDRPEACPIEVYQVMLRCWEYSPEVRATFEEVFNTLAAIHRKM